MLLHRLATEQQGRRAAVGPRDEPLLPVMDRIVYLAGGRAASGTPTRSCAPTY